jgi:uncharacterized protein involved in exopolysaccharide biosynthesis
MEPNDASFEIKTASVPRLAPTTYAAAVTPITPTAERTESVQQHQPENATVLDLQTKTAEHSSNLNDLRQVCANLAASQQQMSANMETLHKDMKAKFGELVEANKSINDRFTQMSIVIESLRSTTPRTT